MSSLISLLSDVKRQRSDTAAAAATAVANDADILPISISPIEKSKDTSNSNQDQPLKARRGSSTSSSFSFPSVSVGSVFLACVNNIAAYGAFVVPKGPAGVSGLVHISEISKERVFDVSKHLKVGQAVWVKCVAIRDSKVSLSMRDVDQATGALITEPVSYK
jgi:ribosomal protein S1